MSNRAAGRNYHEPIPACCPKCHKVLEHAASRVGGIWYCRECGGRCVTISTLRKTLSAGTVNSLWQGAHQSHKSKNKGAACPFCPQKMLRVPHFLPDGRNGQIEIDVCLFCTALWFDGEELEKLGRHFGRKIPLRRSGLSEEARAGLAQHGKHNSSASSEWTYQGEAKATATDIAEEVIGFIGDMGMAVSDLLSP